MKKSMQMLVALVAMSMVLWVAVDSTSEADALSNGVAFGAFVKPVNGQTNITAIQNLERQLGAELPVIRAFSNWDDNIGADHNLHRWVKDNDRDLLVSIKAQRDNGAVIKWRDIANAQPGSTLYRDMQELASGVRRHGDSMTVIFHHEPEAGTNSAFGNNEDFKAAFRKLHNVFEAEGANNAQFAWVMTNWAFAVGDIRPDDPRVADRWYPGDDVVDFIGADPYNWNNCRNTTTEPWRSLEEIIEPFVRWADRKPNKPLILAEFGSDEAGGTRKAEWIDDAHSLFKSGKHKDRFAAVIYFSSDHAAAGHPGCDWFLDSSSNTLNASKRLAQDSFFHTSLSRSSSAQRLRPIRPRPRRQHRFRLLRPLAKARTCFGAAAEWSRSSAPPAQIDSSARIELTSFMAWVETTPSSVRTATTLSVAAEATTPSSAEPVATSCMATTVLTSSRAATGPTRCTAVGALTDSTADTAPIRSAVTAATTGFSAVATKTYWSAVTQPTRATVAPVSTS